MWFLLDRDGVINVESAKFVRSAEQWQPIPGSIDAMVRLKQAGHQLVVITNQSGLARGLFSEDDLAAMHAKLSALLRAQGVTLDGIYYCPHHPDAACKCRKPQPGMLQQAAVDLSFSPQQAVMIGDSGRDIEAGRRFGCATALVLTGNGSKTRTQKQVEDPDFLRSLPVYKNLAALVDDYLQHNTLSGLGG